MLPAPPAPRAANGQLGPAAGAGRHLLRVSRVRQGPPPRLPPVRGQAVLEGVHLCEEAQVRVLGGWV